MPAYLTAPTDQIVTTILAKLRPTNQFLSVEQAIKAIGEHYGTTPLIAERTLIRVLAQDRPPLRLVISDLGVLCNLALPRPGLDLDHATRDSWYQLANSDGHPVWPELAAVRAQVYISPGGHYMSYAEREDGVPGRDKAKTTGGLRFWIVAADDLHDLITRTVAERVDQAARFTDRHGATINKITALLRASGMHPDDLAQYVTADPATRSLTITIDDSKVFDALGNHLDRLDQNTPTH